MAISLMCSIYWPTLYNTNKKSYVASQTQNRHAAAMTRVARNLLWHIQTSILDMAKRLLPASCLLAGFDSGLKFRWTVISPGQLQHKSYILRRGAMSVCYTFETVGVSFWRLPSTYHRLYTALKKFGYLQNKGTFSRNFSPNSGLR